VVYPSSMTNTRRRVFRPPLIAGRVRSIGDQGFAFIPNRFLLDGFFAALGPDELPLYLLLVLAADRRGMSFYHYDTLCSLLQMPRERYVWARDSLVHKALIAFDGVCFQVLELPIKPPRARGPLRSREQRELQDPATVRCLIEESLREAGHRQDRHTVGGQLDDGDGDEER
jgi:hypothetical protein